MAAPHPKLASPRMESRTRDTGNELPPALALALALAPFPADRFECVPSYVVCSVQWAACSVAPV